MLDEELRERLSALERAGSLRVESAGVSRPESAPGGGDAGRSGAWIDASSNDYLGLAAASVSRETLEALVGAEFGSGASRLIHGTRPAHEKLEAELADWAGLPTALLWSSGYAANLGTIAALADAESLIVSDQLNHASIIDGCRLSRARVVVTPHRDVAAVRHALIHRNERRALVVTESIFSMDGNAAPLRELREVCTAHGAALLVDEAHALGILGPNGAGLCSLEGVLPDGLVGTLGKAVGLQGAFVAGSPALRSWLWNRARSFVFSTAPSPVVTALALHQVRLARAADHQRARVLETARAVEGALRARGVPLCPDLRGPILPVLLGDNDRALRVAARLRQRLILTQAIRPPTVPPGGARLRLTITSRLDPAAAARLVEEVTAACREL